MDHTIREFASRYLEQLDCPRALTVFLMVKYGLWEDLASLRCDPLHHASVHSFGPAYAASELLRKYPGLPLKVDRHEAAKAAFKETERTCARTNLRFSRLIGPCQLTGDPLHRRESEFFRLVRKETGSILGPLPSEVEFRFGPGAVYESRGFRPGNLVLGDKLELGLHLTASASHLLPLFERTAWIRERVRLLPQRSAHKIVRGSRFFTVRKTALTDRAACAEPGGNVAFQLGIGRVIRTRLLRVGIDLTTGQSRHGSLAIDASRRGDKATIDLSSASDTICKSLVQLCLPAEWFEALDSGRSHATEIDGHWWHLQKFSSMGNGFTFELETLLFYALIRVATGCYDITVYGDDIIVPTEHADMALKVLAYAGFTPNPRKTFLASEFRESCGTDAFNGVVVPVLRIEEEICSPLSWYSLHNRAALVVGHGRASAYAFSQVPSGLQFGGPRRLGDVVLHGRRRWVREASVRIAGEKHLRGYPEGRALRYTNFEVSTEHHHPSVVLALALKGGDPTRNPSRLRLGVESFWTSFS